MQEVKGPSFTRTFGNMGFFRPPPMPFVDKPRLVTEDDLKTFRKQEGVSLLALRGLQELELSGCSKLTDTSITQVGRGKSAKLAACQPTRCGNSRANTLSA